MTLRQAVKGIRNISGEDVLNMLGLERRRPSDRVFAMIGLFGAGLLVGAGLGIMFAPKSGRELRGQIGERVGELRERGRSVLRKGEEAAREATRPAVGWVEEEETSRTIT